MHQAASDINITKPGLKKKNTELIFPSQLWNKRCALTSLVQQLITNFVPKVYAPSQPLRAAILNF